jgi:hypothetical protein
MDFLLIKKPTITLKPHFFEQLILFEDILRKKYQANLTKDWYSDFYNSEDELITNTYLNTLLKGRKSPRASAAITDKSGKNRVGITWSKKLKNVLPSTLISNAEIMKSVQSNFAQSEIVSDIQTQLQESGLGAEDSKSVSTQKKPFKVILKSKSAKSFEDRAYQTMSGQYKLQDTPTSTSKTPNDFVNVYDTDKSPIRPATSNSGEKDRKVVRRNHSITKELTANDTEIAIKPFKFKEIKSSDVTKFRPATESDTDRTKTFKSNKSELDKIKEQLNIHYGSSTHMPVGRLGSRSGKSLPEMMQGNTREPASVFERTPLNQLISSEDTHGTQDTSKTVKRGPIRSNYKMEIPEAGKQTRNDQNKKNMFNINTIGTGSRQSRSRVVQSADKPADDRKSGISTHGTIKSILNAADNKQLGYGIQNKKPKPRPSRFYVI